MFESGRALFDPSYEEHVTRRFALSIYGVYCVVGLFGDAFALRRHATLNLVIYTAVVLLSLTWLGTTIKSGPPTKRRFVVCATILMSLAVIVPDIIHLFSL